MTERKPSKADIALKNDLIISDIVALQKIIREDEISVLSEISLPMVTRSIKRLEKQGKVLRDKTSLGVLVRAKYKKYNSPLPYLPPSWRHDAFCFYVLKEMAKLHKLKEITEKEIRLRKIHNHIADGKLVDAEGKTTHIIEVEWAYKSGVNLRKMIKNAVAHSILGIVTIFAFPDFRKDFQPVHHSKRLLKAINAYFEEFHYPEELKERFFYFCVHFNNANQLQNVRPQLIQEWDLEIDNPADAFAFE